MVKGELGDQKGRSVSTCFTDRPWHMFVLAFLTALLALPTTYGTTHRVSYHVPCSVRCSHDQLALGRGDRGGGQGVLGGHEGRPVSLSSMGRGTCPHGRLPADVFEERGFLAEAGGQPIQKVLEGAVLYMPARQYAACGANSTGLTLKLI